MMLAVDTSTDQAGIAVMGLGRVESELSWVAARNHSRHLSGAVRTCLTLASGAIPDLTELAVATGPGSFSGLRVGISWMKGLAMSRGLPLVGIPTLDVIAWEASTCGGPVWALIPAGRGEMFVRAYDGAGSEWRAEGPPSRVPIEVLARSYQEDALLTGPGADALAGHLRRLGTVATVPTPPRMLRRPSYLAELARRRLEAGSVPPAHELEPLYLRRPAAEEKRTTTGEEKS
jgi:tRNA threonylcarbamoyladenosine biosynthesis protein TsaB